MKALLVLAVALATCSRAPTVDVTSDDDCGLACAAWQRLGCDEGKPTPKGRTCVDVCTSGLAVALSPRAVCVAAADSCEGARWCWR